MENGNLKTVHGLLGPCTAAGISYFNSFHFVEYLSVVPRVLQ